MEEKELKTSVGQRIVIILIAVIMIGSIIASYAAIVISNSSSSNKDDSSSSKISDEKKAEIAEAYQKKAAEFAEATKSDYEKFVQYRTEVKAYNETTANENGVQTKDLEAGTGEEVKEDGSNYLAYYIGWCADESVFDSSFDDDSNPTGFTKALDPSMGLIEGWLQGVKGMKIGGVRRITIPGELAYGESMEICGGTNKPLRFLVMPVARDESLETLTAEVMDAQMRYQYAEHDLDYDEVMKNNS